MSAFAEKDSESKMSGYAGEVISVATRGMASYNQDGRLCTQRAFSPWIALGLCFAPAQCRRAPLKSAKPIPKRCV